MTLSIPMEEKHEAKKASNKRQILLEEEEEENKNKEEVKKKKKRKRKEIQVKIETVNEHPEKVSPLVGYFPSGFDPLKDRTHEGQGQNSQPRVRVFKNVKRTNRLELVVSPNGSQIDFVGTNYSGEAAAPQVCTYALGILDKHTQTLKIVQIEAKKIFRLEPRVRDSDEPDNEPVESLKVELTAEEKDSKLHSWLSKKTVRRAKKLSLHRNQDPESQEDLDMKLVAIKLNKGALEVDATTTNNARNIPPHDMSATHPQMAYPLDKIIFKGEWEYLSDILELLRVGKEVAPDAYPIFVCNRVHKLEEFEDAVVKETLACIFSYITHLIKFKDKHSMDGVSSAKYHRFPTILSQKFNTMFGNSDSKRLADDKRDLLISYVLVLTLFADNFKTDPSDIAKDLRMSSVDLRPHFQYLGCKYEREGKIFKLPAPLQFPSMKQKRRK